MLGICVNFRKMDRIKATKVGLQLRSCECPSALVTSFNSLSVQVTLIADILIDRQMNKVIKIVITGKNSWQDLQGDLLRAIFWTLVE
jgi:hypothetical protein